MLIESLGADQALDTSASSAAMESALEAGLIADAAIAQSADDCHAFWALRDDVGQVVHGGMPIVFDISLPISAMESYVATLRETLQPRNRRAQALDLRPSRRRQSARRGAGQADGLSGAAAEGRGAGLSARSEAFNGSVSAEHGIGLEKKPYLRSAAARRDRADADAEDRARPQAGFSIPARSSENFSAARP